MDYNKLDAIQSTLIGVLLLVAGIYLLAGYDIINNAVIWIIIGVLLVIKGLSFIRI
ncbi:hypothetical protein [Candidatus Chromulinivorax destructor]|uniref:hypothetical protein n=1 Tax=Candidatus Chromulinivorax destructor TaxID=2066483 RepID=UPI0013B3D624|nr:hypothetical protein [Candidatus Chromulinivorax destructor]